MILDLAMEGSSVDHGALVEFLCARHPRRVRAAKAKWEGYHDDSLVDKLADELSGDMQVRVGGACTVMGCMHRDGPLSCEGRG
jgi:hypothetical protein